MHEDETKPTERMFSPWARVVLAVFSLAFGLILVLWASGQGSPWKYAPALFCFAIVGAAVLPGRLAKLCGRIVALGIVSTIAFLIIDGFEELTVLSALQAIAWIVVFGVPATLYLIRGELPFKSYQSDSPATVEFDDLQVRCDWPEDESTSMRWDEISTVTLVTTDEGPWIEDVYWILEDGNADQIVIPHGASGHEEFLAEMQRRFPGFNDDAVIQAMGTTSNDTFLVWSRAALDH